MRLSQFHFDLPDRLIAQEPIEPRDAARLLDCTGGALADRTVRDLPELLRPDDLVVVNDTRVRPARLFGKRTTGGRVEILFLTREPGGAHRALVRANKRLRPGEMLIMDGGVQVTLIERPDADAVWRLEAEGDLDRALDASGHVPLPPYIRRPDRAEDRDRYQTMFARHAGSAAAPTASLHFTPELAARLDIVTVTLHVGYGTFQPVETDEIEDHRMHREEFEVSPETAERIANHRGRIVAVGTTTTRVLETLARSGGIRPGPGSTDLYLYPGAEFRAVDVLLTNFHVSQSSLLLLVCAFGGTERMLDAYRHAVEAEYRFFSYGDAMLIDRDDQER